MTDTEEYVDLLDRFYRGHLQEMLSIDELIESFNEFLDQCVDRDIEPVTRVKLYSILPAYSKRLRNSTPC
ncbi:MAG: hypothetical protein R6V83_01540 [Candidatus Thorarchaeota archaeon]